MKELIKKIGSILTRIFGVGDISLTRILSAVVVTDIMSVWTFNCIKSGTISDIPWGTVAIFSTAFTCKVIQRFAENNKKETEG
jgi:hypothetical protein